MVDAVRVENLNFSYGENVVFENLSFTLEKGSFLTVLGSGGCGKSTLFRIFNEGYNEAIHFFNKPIEFFEDAGYVSLSLDYFKENIVVDELIGVLKSRGVNGDKIKGQLERIVKKLGIGYMVNSPIRDLSNKDRILLMFAYQFLKKPKLLILDSVLSYLDREYGAIVKELIRFGKRGTIINITNNTSECLIGNKVYFLDRCEMYDTCDLTYDVFWESNLRVPFMLMLSSRLKDYNLINKNYFDKEVLVDDLWK